MRTKAAIVAAVAAAVAWAWLALAGVPACAQSTINTGQPASNADLNSLVVRQLALAAASDINNLLGMHASTSLGQCPSGTSVAIGEDCLTVGSSPYGWYKWTGSAGGWAEVATINPSSGVVSVALNSGNLVGNPPIEVNISSGVATLSLLADSNFAVNGSSQLALNPGAGNLVLASPNGSSGEPSLRALVGADLPAPTPTTLGGVESYAAISHQWINAISVGGAPSSTQPAAADLSNGVTGSGSVVLQTGSTLITPTLGVASGTSLTLGGATIGGNALAVTGSTLHTGADTIASASASALAVGANGSTNPAFSVDSSATSQATGWLAKGFAAGNGASWTVQSSSTNESGYINAKGSGSVNIGFASTGGVTLGNGGGGVSIGSALTYGSVTLANTFTGSGGSSLVGSLSPTLTTPNLGTPSAVNLTNGTALPVSTGISGFGTGVATALAVNTGSVGAVSTIIAQGTITLNTTAVASAACSTAQTATATGALTTDDVDASFNADPTSTTGYTPGAQLSIVTYLTANTFNAKVCNNTGNSITPGAVTLNWKVRR